MSLVVDIPGRGNSTYEGSEAGMHMVYIRNSEKASGAAAEGASCSVGHWKYYRGPDHEGQ